MFFFFSFFPRLWLYFRYSYKLLNIFFHYTFVNTSRKHERYSYTMCIIFLRGVVHLNIFGILRLGALFILSQKCKFNLHPLLNQISQITFGISLSVCTTSVYFVGSCTACDHLSTTSPTWDKRCLPHVRINRSGQHYELPAVTRPGVPTSWGKCPPYVNTIVLFYDLRLKHASQTF